MSIGAVEVILIHANITTILQKYKEFNFKFNEMDCCLFVSKVLEDYYGEPITTVWDNVQYSNLREAVKTIRKLGCKDMSELPSKVLNVPRKNINNVEYADIVYYINEDNMGIMGVCNGKRSYFLGKNGKLTARDTNECLYCWSVE